MSADASMLEEQLDETIHSLLEEAGSILVVNPAPDVFRRVIMTATEFEDELPDIRVLATPDVLKTGVDDFILASQVADLVDANTLSLRTTTDIARNSLLVGDDQVVAIVSLDGGMTGLVSTDADFVENVRTTFADEWETGEDFSLRTPPISRVENTLADEFGEDVRDDFEMVLDSVDTVPGEDDDLDEVTIALLVAAHNEELLYDISKWGEDTGVASKATFSRTKTRLEDRGLIETEKVPIDVGRPRLRLFLVPDDLQDVDHLAERVSA
ncbi:transcriptional regulator TbsP [Haladaptatus sp. NG-WS-4]